MILGDVEQDLLVDGNYDHTQFQGRRKFLRFLLKNVGFTMLAKIDHVEGLDNVPLEGPAILMINHIAYIDPIVVMHSLPRDIIPLAKIEVYDLPLVGIFPRIWGVIPVRRDEVDRRAVKLVLNVLKAGEIVLVAPEGTRSDSLQQAKEGIAYLATRSNVPVIPTAISGTFGYPAFRTSKVWNEDGAIIKFGRPFKFSQKYKRAGIDELRILTDEAMYLLADMLPEEQRGYYSDLSQATRETIEWLE